MVTMITPINNQRESKSYYSTAVLPTREINLMFCVLDGVCLSQHVILVCFQGLVKYMYKVLYHLLLT